MNDLIKSRQVLFLSMHKLQWIRAISPAAFQELSPRFAVLSRQQSELEQSATRSQKPRGVQMEGFFIPALYAGAAVVSSFFGFKATQQLTEATDYDKRLDKFIEAKGQGLSDTQALQLIGGAGGFGIGSAIVIGSLAIAAIFLFRK